MSRLRKRLSIIMLVMLAAVLVVAPVFAYLYRATYVIQESTHVTYTMLPVEVASPNTWMVANGFMSTTALDTTVETFSGTVRPHMVTDDAIWTAAAVPADSQVNLYFTTGNTPSSAMSVIVGVGGFITNAADTPLHTDLWGVEISGYFDLATAGNYYAITGADSSSVIISRLSATEIRVAIQPTATSTDPVQNVDTTVLTSGAHTFRITSGTGGNFYNTYWDGVPKTTAAITNTLSLGAATGAVFMSNSMPYASYLKVGDAPMTTLTVWYQPATIVSGIVMPDRSAGAHNGSITFGANPAGIAVSLGELTGSAQSPTTTTSTIPDTLPDVEVSDWFGEPDLPTKLLTNPLRGLVTLVSDNTTLTELQVWRLYGVIFVLIILVLTAVNVHGHYLITGIAAGVAIGVCVAATVFPLWALVFMVGAVLGGIIAERSPSL